MPAKSAEQILFRIKNLRRNMNFETISQEDSSSIDDCQPSGLNPIQQFLKTGNIINQIFFSSQFFLLKFFYFIQIYKLCFLSSLRSFYNFCWTLSRGCFTFTFWLFWKDLDQTWHLPRIFYSMMLNYSHEEP